jgi:hypothetical protein
LARSKIPRCGVRRRKKKALEIFPQKCIAAFTAFRSQLYRLDFDQLNTMKFPLLTLLAAASTAPAVAEFYLKEQFNDDVSNAESLRAVVDKAIVL